MQGVAHRAVSEGALARVRVGVHHGVRKRPPYAEWLSHHSKLSSASLGFGAVRRASMGPLTQRDLVSYLSAHSRL